MHLFVPAEPICYIVQKSSENDRCKPSFEFRAKCFDLRHSRRPILASRSLRSSQQGRLGRAEIPCTDPWTVPALKPAAMAPCVSTHCRPLGNGLSFRHGHPVQVNRQKIRHIEPHLGAQTARVGTMRAGSPAETVQEERHRGRTQPDRSRRHNRLMEFAGMIDPVVGDTSADLDPVFR